MASTSDRWQRIEALFHSALERDSVSRAAFLDGACGQDADLRREVESLLAGAATGQGLPDHPTTALLAESPAGALIPGTRLGPYQIEALIGEGGMGKVYKTRDTRLGRTVAIKTSSARFSQRFEREARAVAALNHPHICHLYDVGPDYLVMEYIEGSPLKGPMPADRALEYAEQILGALDAAHRKGIVHRDLKPGNILLSKQGIKLLDFGLAQMAAGPNGSSTPTMTQMTQPGAVLGTPAYMAPEQREGKQADARSDIYSFGCVFYEMLTGNRVSADRAAVAPPLEDILRTCLEKDPDERWQSARELKHALRWTSEAKPATAAPPRSWFGIGGWMAACVFAVGAVWAALQYRHPPAAASVAFRFQIPFTGAPASSGAFALSPDGHQLAFTAVGPDGIRRLWIRALDSLELRPLPGADVGQQANPLLFWSPDSRFIAFDAGRRLKRIDISSGVAQTICELPGLEVGGSWNTDGVIILGNDSPRGGLLRVSAAGGTASPLTRVDPSRNERIHALPSFLPDGRHFLYYRNSATPENAGTYVGSLDADPGKQDSRQLIAAVSALYAPSFDSSPGQLLFLRDGILLSQTFDPTGLRLSGEPVPVAEQVGNILAYGLYSTSNNGILAYRTRAQDFQLTWLDRQGKTMSRVSEPGAYESFAVSPDGTRAVVSRTNAFQGTTASNLWLLDLARGTNKRFTSSVGRNDHPVWSPDGSGIVFVSSREGGATSNLNLYQKLASGNEDETALFRSGEAKIPTSWSRDGRFLLYTVADPKTKNDIWVLSMDGDHRRTRLLGTEFSESQAQFSPDSRWIAYTSDASGRDEVYVRGFPEAGEDFVVSRGGGHSPRWRGDGKELYYISLDGKMMAVEVASGRLFQPGTPKPLFQASGALPEWNVTADGQRFLFAVPVEQTQAPFTVVSNWMAALKK
jgi:Tol biopolymer transport system component/predicted Ser/Thr protein kinase